MPTQEDPMTSLRWWDISAVAAILVTGSVIAAGLFGASPAWASGIPAGLRSLILAAPLLLFVLWYLLLGRAMIANAGRQELSNSQRNLALLLLVIVLAFGAFASPMYAILQVLVYPIVWMAGMPYRAAIAWNGAVALAVGIGMFAGLAPTGPGAALASSLITAPISFAFAVAMGTWITHVYKESERHREMAEQLRASQAKVKALSEAAGAASERERLSRDLHDTLTQTLTGLVMLAEQTEHALAKGDFARLADRVGRISTAAREAVAEARALVTTTQPLGSGGLSAAIERVANRMREDTGLDVRCEIEETSLDREREVVLLRAAQEGLANARRHSHASTVHLPLTPLDRGGAVLTVTDDGVGPGNNHQNETGGFGLSGLTDRVQLVGGSVSFGPGKPGGARLEVTV